MDVVSQGPLPVASLLWQTRPSSWVLTVVCKATFALAPAVSKLAPVQEPIREQDAHWDDDPARSLREASDLAPVKQRADVVLVGHAYSPGGKSVRSLVVRMIVGDLDKSVQVFSDRVFTQQDELQEGARFARMPLVYERAAGGPETSNPSGVRRDAPDSRGRISVPNLLPVDHVVSAPEDFIPVIGLGPIAPSWPSRRAKLGRHATWTPAALAKNPLPEDLDRSFFNVAPLDQRVMELRDDERIVLENLHPDHERLVTSLPGIRPRATVTGRPGGPRDLPMRFDTLVIDTDRQLCTATFRAELPLSGADEQGQVHVAMDGAAAERAAANKPPAAKPAAPKGLSLGAATIAIDMSQPLTDIPLTPATPFRPGPPAPPPPPPAAAKPSIAAAPASKPVVKPALNPFAGSTLEIDTSAPLPDIALTPFRAPSAAAPSSQAPAPQTPAPQTPAPQTPALQTRASQPPAPPPLIPSLAAPSPAAPVSPWAAAAPASGATAGGTAAPVAPDVPAPETPQTIGAVLAASHAAAGVSAHAAGAPRVSEIGPASGPAPIEARRDALVLVWLDRAMVPRIVRKPAWQRLLDEIDDEPIDPEADDPALSDEPAEIEDQAQVFEILDRAAATDVDGVHEALARAAGKRGKLVPPLELVDGELVLPFDEVETLKALVSTTTPLASGDDALAGAIVTAEKFLATPGVATAPSVADALGARIREALAHGKRGKMREAVDEQVERALLEQRCYQKRKVLGGPHLRGLLYASGAEQPLVTYLPVAIAEELPLAARFRARVIGAAHPAVDEREAEPVALRAAAVGRVVQIGRR